MNKEVLHKKILLFPLLLALYEIATYLSNDAYLPALPHIARDLNASNHLIQLTLTTWFMGTASMQLFLGPLADRVGRRPILLVGGLVFIASTIGCALAHDIYLLLALRFIQGASITSLIAGYATIHELFNREQAIYILAIITSIVVLAPSFGPLFGAIILLFTGWRWIFGLLAVWAAVVVGGLFISMPETKPANQERMKFTKILIQYKNIVLNKSFMSLTLIFSCLLAAIIAWITAGPFLIINRFHLTTLKFGIIQAFVFGSFIIGTQLVKLLMKYFRLNNITKTGIVLSLIGGIYALLSSLIWPTILWNMIIAMMLLAGGSGIAFPILSRLAIESSNEPMGSRVAVSSCSMGASGMFGSAIISSIYNGTLFRLGLILFIFSIIAIILTWKVQTLKKEKIK